MIHPLMQLQAKDLIKDLKMKVMWEDQSLQLLVILENKKIRMIRISKLFNMKLSLLIDQASYLSANLLITVEDLLVQTLSTSITTSILKSQKMKRGNSTQRERKKLIWRRLTIHFSNRPQSLRASQARNQRYSPILIVSKHPQNIFKRKIIYLRRAILNKISLSTLMIGTLKTLLLARGSKILIKTLMRKKKSLYLLMDQSLRTNSNLNK